MSFLDWLINFFDRLSTLFDKKTPPRKSIYDLCADRMTELLSPHLGTLAKKKKRLIQIDDYGVPIMDKWSNELMYFYERVLLSDFKFAELERKYLSDDVNCILGRRTFLMLIDGHVNLYSHIDDDNAEPYSPNFSGEDYEYFCANILKQSGWHVVVTPNSGDQGIDIIATKHNMTLAIQCKNYFAPVGNKAVQEAYAGSVYYEANSSAVVAPVEYTSSAIELASKLGVLLLHHDDLINLCVD